VVSDLLKRLKVALADRYTIEREIGSGGMATVYLAEDLKHHRHVAIKVLDPELARALGAERFLREVEVTAKLTHPHILPLYDSGEADGFLYYVMPFVEGESLRDRLGREKQLAIDDALQVAWEVADALSYAHSHGVIHRDIKPENILLESGHAVVADFGIARAIDAAGGARLTETGLSIGTPMYMSPEQAGGEKDLDGRSDLYSLGCVLHEMLAGQPPFTGPTVESLVHQHLSAEPPSVTAVRPSVPGWIAAALERSLAKTPADRFNPVALFGEAISPRTSVAADARPVAVAGRRRWLVPGVLAAVLVIVIAVVLYGVMGPRPITITTSNTVQVTRDPGVEFQPAISPDGEEVAYVLGPLGAPRIVVRSTRMFGGGGETRPGEEIGGRHWFPIWMRDGASLRLFACQPVGSGTGSDCEWKEVGKLGGSVRTIPRTLINNRLSPDGTRVVARRGDSIFAYVADDGEPELLGVHRVEAWGQHSFAWSPDGRRIAYVNGNAAWRHSANVAAASIWVIDADGGEPVPITDERDLNVSPQWLPDSRHLLFVFDREGQREVYVVAVGPTGSPGEPQKVPGPTDAHSISVSRDGRRLAYAKFVVAQNIWSVAIPRSGSVSVRDAVPVTTGNQVIEEHGLSPDGEWIAFDSDIRGDTDIHKQRLAGGTTQLVADLENEAFSPKWSPDGSEIAFYAGAADTGGMSEVYVVSADGRTPRERLTDFPGWDSYPDWAPDGLAIAYGSQGPQGTSAVSIWIVSRDSVGGPWSDPVQLMDFFCVTPAWAPDGASLVCRAGSELVRVSREGEVLLRYGMPPGLTYPNRPKFSRDGSRIYFTATQEDGSRGIWRVPVDGGIPDKVVAFDDPAVQVDNFFSVGPEQFYLTIAEYESDIYVMDLEW
jgi:serine/threonine-protein kinase